MSNTVVASIPGPLDRWTLVSCLLLAVTLVAHAAPAQLPKGPHVIVGRVLDMTTDTPIAGAVVSLTTSEAAAERDRTGVRPATRNVMTATDGSFVLRDLADGKYTIGATAFGYVRVEQLIVDVKNGSLPAPLTLRAWKHASISGRVLDERGDPLVGVPVSALLRQSVGGALVLRNESPAADTDDRGVYHLAGLTPGNYVVGVLATSVSIPVSLAESVSATASNPTARFQLTSGLLPSGAQVTDGDGLRIDDFVHQRMGPPLVLSPDGRALTYATTMFPGTSFAGDATVITLGSGEARTGVDLPMRFVAGVPVSGVVTGPDGPMKHQAVRLIAAGTPEIDSFEATGVASGITDANGRFAFVGVPPGAYDLLSTFVALANRNENTPGIALSARQTVTVGDTGVSGLDVVMKSPPRIIGRVEFKAAPGTSRSAEDRLTMVLRPVAATVWRALPADVQLDGTFAVSGLMPGRHELYSSSAGGWRVVNVVSGGRPQPDYVIDLGDRDLTGVIVTLSNANRRVSGTVADTKGAPDPDAQVVVFPADTAVWREGIFHSRRVQRVRASSTGAFELTFLAPGDYYVTAVSSRHSLEWQDPLFLERLIPGATKITLADGDDKTMALVTFTVKR